MRLKKIVNIALIAMVFLGLVLSFTPVFAGYNVSVEAEGFAFQGAKGSAYTVILKNLGSEKIDQAEVYITQIDGRPVTSDGKYRVSNNPQIVKFLGAKGDRIIFPLNISNDVEVGIKDVRIEIIIDDETIVKTGSLEIGENTSAPITEDSVIDVSAAAITAPNQNVLLTLAIENPKSNPYDISNIEVELIGIASDPEYSDLTEVPTLSAEEFDGTDFFTYAVGGRNIVTTDKRIEPGKTNKRDIAFSLATGSSVELGTFYPVFKVTYHIGSEVTTFEVKDPATVTIEVKKVSWFKAPFRWFLDMLKGTAGFGSYGIAIIILGILLKVVLIPLTNVQFKSMKKNAEVQPLIKKLNEKYPGKENAQKRQEETMKIYKEHNVNLFAGCFPLLIQMPIIIALYTAISNYAPLNFASFLWLPSLGAPDPIWIMAILMAASTWFQQRVSQMPGQESNVAFQVIFPLFLGYIAFSFPAALTLYWVTFSIVSIAHQMVFNKQAFGSYMLKTTKPAPAVVDSKK